MGEYLSSVSCTTSLGKVELNQATKILTRKFGALELAPLDLANVYSQYTGPRRARYAAAHRRFLAEGFDIKKASIVRLHVKAEKLNLCDNVAPRCILARSLDFNLQLGAYTKPLESYLYAMKGFDWFDVPRTRLIAKGLSSGGRGALFMRKWSHFQSPVVISMDCKGFDKHVTREQLDCEHRVYLAAYKQDPFLKSLLRAQLTNRCKFEEDSYTLVGKRMSGDMNTALGNCLVSVILVLAAARRCGLRKFDMMLDGDDVMLFIEGEDRETVVGGFPEAYLDYGHELRIDGVAVEPWEVTFCKSKLLKLGSGYHFVREPERVLSTAFVSRNFGQAAQGMRMMRWIAECNMHLYKGVPVLDALFRRMLEILPTALPKGQLDLGLAMRVSREPFRDVEVTEEARAWYHLATGCSPAEQLDWEHQWRSVRLDDVHLSNMGYGLEGWPVGDKSHKGVMLAHRCGWGSAGHR